MGGKFPAGPGNPATVCFLRTREQKIFTPPVLQPRSASAHSKRCYFEVARILAQIPCALGVRAFLVFLLHVTAAATQFRRTMATFEDNTFGCMLLFAVFISALSRGHQWITNIRKEHSDCSIERCRLLTCKCSKWDKPDFASPSVYLVLSILPFVSAVDSEYSAAAILVLTLLVPLQVEKLTKERQQSLLYYLIETKCLERPVDPAGYSVYPLKNFGAFLSVSVLVALLFKPGMISLVRIDEKQKDVLGNMTQFAVVYLGRSGFSSARIWAILALSMVFGIGLGRKCHWSLRLGCLAAKLALIFVLEFTKSIGYRTCEDFTECLASLYGGTPKRIYQLYTVLIVLSCTLLMDNGFRFDVRGKNSDKNESQSLGSDGEGIA